MTPDQILEKLHASEEFVVTELQRVQLLYELKREIRYDHTRKEERHTESVAEHIYGMHCLVDYFLPLEDRNFTWNERDIRAMIQYHDIDEIITGDTLGYKKSKSDLDKERIAAEQVINDLPLVMQQSIRNTLDAYEAQKSIEARFVKALDKVEPIFHLYNQTGKTTLNSNKTTRKQMKALSYHT